MKSHHVHFAAGLGGLTFVAFAVFHLQERLGLLPCPLCVIQRIFFILFSLTALAAALHRPAGALRWLWAGLLGLWAALGAAVAAWQVYLTYNPLAAECGISPEERFLNGLPLAKWWPAMFEANGDCTRVVSNSPTSAVPALSLLAVVPISLLRPVAALRPASR